MADASKSAPKGKPNGLSRTPATASLKFVGAHAAAKAPATSTTVGKPYADRSAASALSAQAAKAHVIIVSTTGQGKPSKAQMARPTAKEVTVLQNIQDEHIKTNVNPDVKKSKEGP